MSKPNNKMSQHKKISQPTTMENAFQDAVRNLSKKKQTEVIANHIYSKYEVFRKFKPLAIGIDEDLLQELASRYDPDLILRFLAIHCRKPRYVKSLSLGGKRFNLKGSVKGEISSQEQEHALNNPFVKKTTNTQQISILENSENNTVKITEHSELN